MSSPAHDAAAPVVGVADIAAAAARLRPHLPPTPLRPVGADRVLVKAEHLQRTGSFKIRGALNAVLTADADRVVTASSGNHGLGIATAAAIVGATARVHLPRGASPSKMAAIRRAGAQIVVASSTDALAGEHAAREEAQATGVPYISPYNDPAVIAGQGTIAVELLEQLAEPPERVVIAVGGGGMISGIATYLAAHAPETEVIGAQPEQDAAMMACLAAGRVVAIDGQPTFSDGTAGNLEVGAITLPLVERLVDRWITVAEVDIARAVAWMVDEAHELVEGAAGLAIAAARSVRDDGATVAVSCGANVSAAVLREMLAVAAAEQQP